MTEESVHSFYDHYQKNGFYFPSSILTTYTLSLNTKPFVLLSGISGTGKTKIAQLFHIPHEKHNSKAVHDHSILKIKVPIIYDRFNFPQESLPNILDEEDLKKFEEQAEKYRQMGDEGNFSDTYILDIEDDYGNFQIGIYGQRASSPLIRGRYYKSNRDKLNPHYDARQHLSEHYKPNDILTLKKIGNKRFKVVSINDKNSVEEVREYHYNEVDRYCFISVRSDWTDSTELFGFYNMIDQRYHVPKFLNFLLKAINNPDYPFFVLFDEMNLSKVEHYFSDILSCIESRVLKNGYIDQEKVVLHSGLNQLETDSEDFEYIPNAIEIPLNLYFTGTVNIDESTYMFSPKVLDRANVIEFNTVDLNKYDMDDYSDDYDGYKLNQFPDFSNLLLPTRKNYQELPQLIKKHLININQILQKYNLHFGFRTVNEIALYIHNASLYIDDTDEIKMKALDYQLVQKVFPKLNGTYAEIEEPLRECIVYLSNQEKIETIDANKTSFPVTVAKLLKMYTKLSKNGYANFIE